MELGTYWVTDGNWNSGLVSYWWSESGWAKGSQDFPWGDMERDSKERTINLSRFDAKPETKVGNSHLNFPQSPLLSWPAAYSVSHCAVLFSSHHLTSFDIILSIYLFIVLFLCPECKHLRSRILSFLFTVGSSASRIVGSIYICQMNEQMKKSFL